MKRAPCAMNRRKFLSSVCAAVIVPVLPIVPKSTDIIYGFSVSGHSWSDATADMIYNDISSMFNQLMKQGAEENMTLAISPELSRLLESEHG